MLFLRTNSSYAVFSFSFVNIKKQIISKYSIIIGSSIDILIIRHQQQQQHKEKQHNNNNKNNNIMKERSFSFLKGTMLKK